MFKNLNSQKSLAEKDISKIEGSFYRGELKYDEVIKTLEQPIPGLSEAERQERENMANLFKAMENHHEANLQFLKIGADLDNASEKEFSTITRAEYNNFLASHPEKENLLKTENKALETYEKSLHNFPTTKFIDENDISLLMLDLRYRQTERIRDAQSRDEALKKLNKEYESIISGIKDHGKKAESVLVWTINKWLQKEKLDHVISIFHTLPRDDHYNKIDNILVYGNHIANINLKSYSHSSDVIDFNTAKRHEEERKTLGSNIHILELDSQETNEVYALSRRDNLGKGEKIKLGKLINNLVNQTINLVDDPEKIKSATRKPKRKHELPSVKKIEREYSDASTLKSLGYLTEGEENNPDLFITAKQKLLTDLRDKQKAKSLKEKILQIKNAEK